MTTVKAKIGHQMHSFEYYPTETVRRSKFNRSHSLITTFNAGYLIPIWHDIAYPGDTLELSARSFTRLTTQIVPFMSNVYMDVHFWCVPIRLIWEHWQAMNGEQPNPGDSTDYLTPQLTTDSTTPENTVMSIYDYFNIPVNVADLSFNAFNFRAYNLVWNEWYRDENLQNRVTQAIGDTDTTSNYQLLPRGKRKDYFTGALPWPQKGAAVDLPLGSVAPVIDSGSTSTADLSGVKFRYASDGSIASFTTPADLGVGSNGSPYVGTGFVSGTPSQVDMSLVADLSSATAATINTLRQAFALQRMLEKDARGGTRYIEMILSHFGVKSPDARLQRPEFLGGGTFMLDLNVVPQTSETTNSSPLGDLASYGIIQGATKRIVHSFTEHCIVFGLASVRPEYYYQQGLERDYSRRERVDFYLPVTAHLGEQAVLNKEIYAQGSSVVDSDGDVIDEQVFGYQERWSEMRYKQSYITGQTRSTATTPLDVWHLGTEYGSLPALSSQFIQEDGVVIDRALQLKGFNNDGSFSNTPQFISNFFFEEYWTRPMPVYSTPGYIDHF